MLKDPSRSLQIPFSESFLYRFFFVLRSFLDDLYRIAHRGYEPTDDDIVRARLRTVGVQEFRFMVEIGTHLDLDTWMCVIDCYTAGGEAGREWIFYDVGGSRSHVSTVTWLYVCSFV